MGSSMDFEFTIACFGGLIVFLVILHGIDRVYNEAKALYREADDDREWRKSKADKWLDEYNKKHSKNNRR